MRRSGARGSRNALRPGGRTVPLLVVLAAALAMWGCGMAVTELPSNTQPGGPGFLSITTQQINDGVQGVSYSTVINTSGGSGRLTTCTVATGALPAGFTFPSASGSTCVLTTNGQPVTGAPGKYTFTLEAGDSSTPQRTDQRVYSLTIRPRFTVNAPVVLDGVAARSYTRTFTVTTNLQNHTGSSIISSTEAGNGPITQCVISGLPTGFASGGGSASCAADATGVNVTVVMRAPPGTLGTGVYPFSISVTDSPISSTGQAGVVAPASTATIQPSLVVRQEFSLTQAALEEGVQGRTYGVAPLAQGVTTNTVAAAPAVESGQAAELGNGPLTSCSLTVSPADPALSVSVDPKDPARCLLTISAAVAAAGTYTVTVSATDNPILDPASPGAVVVPANTRQEQLTWMVAQPISYSLNFDSAQGQTGQVPSAVQNRSYGSAPKSPLVLTASGGLSASDGLSIALSGSVPAGIICATPQPNPQPPGLTAQLTCTSSGNTVSASPGTASFSVTASDAGNSATPPGSISSDALGHTSHALTVEAPLGLAPSISDPLPPAVSGRSYAVAPSTPLVYTASGGLGGYHFSTPPDVANPGAAFPQGVACTMGPTMLTCSASAITAVGSATPYGPVPVTLDDTANQTTPDGATSSPVTTTTVNRTLLVNPPLAITPSGSASPGPPAGVVGRTYGSTGFSPLVYTVTGGDPPYTITPIPSLAVPATNGFPAPVSCVVGNAPGQTTPNDQITCASASGVSAAVGSYPFTVSVTDAGSGGTAPASTSLSQSVMIDAALSLTPQSSTIPLAVVGRTYGDLAVTCASAPCQPIGYNISGGLGGYSESTVNPGPVVISGFPGTFSCAFTSTGSLTGTYACSTASAVAGSNPSALSITATDTANSATPSTSVTNSALSLEVNQPLTLTPPAGEAPVTAVFNRAYGSGGGCSGAGGLCQPIVYDVANGTQSYPASATLATTAGPFTCSLSGTTYNCGSTGISLNPSTPTVEPLDASVTDLPNASTPAGTATNSTLSLTVNPQLGATGPSGTLAIAVSNRTYGSGSACGAGGTSACATIPYTVSNGLGGYSGSAGNPTPPTLNGYPATFACPFTPTITLSGSYACASSTGVTAVATPTADTVSLKITDTANASTPSGRITTSTATLQVDPVLSFTPPATVNPAVQGRAYGTGPGCSGGTCQALPYGISGGTDNYLNPATLTTTAGSFTCPLVGSNYDCSTTSPISGAPGSATLNISTFDIANASTPAASTSDRSKSLVIDAPLSSTGPSGTLAAAVSARTYGSGSNCGSGGTSPCASIGYTVANGLGGYSGSTSNPTPPTLNGYPSSFTCPFTSTGALSGSYACASTAGVTAVGTAVNDTVSLRISDTPSTTTPSGSTTTLPAATLPVNPAMTIAPATTQGPPALGVVGSAYGSGSTCGSAGTSACAPIQYTVSGGLGNYAASAALTEATTLSGFTCPVSGTTYSCSATTLGPATITAQVPNDTLSITTTETGDASTPGGTTPANTSLNLTVNPALQLLVSPPNPPSVGPPSDAVTNRSYGTAPSPDCTGSGGPAACAPLQFTAAFGTGTPYTFTDASTLTTTGGFTCSTAPTTYTCSSTKVLAAAPTVILSGVAVKDAANASAPAAPSPVSLGTNLAVAAPLAVTTTSVAPPALIDYNKPSYASNALAATGGLPAYSWVAPGGTSGGCAPPSTPALPAGLSLVPGTGIFTGTATAASAADTQFSFGVCVTDIANAATPAGAAYPPPGATTSTLTLNVLNRFAFIADTGTGDVRVIETGDNVASPVIPPSIPTAPPGPQTQTNMQGPIAVTPNGLYAFIPLTASNGFAVFDTITNSALPKSPFLFPSGATCTAPVGVAFSADSQNAFFACSGNSEVVDVNISNIAGASGTVSGVASSAATTGNPTAVAISGTSLFVVTSGSPPEILVYALPSLTSPVTANLATGITPEALALVTSGSAVDAFVAEQVSPTVVGQFQEVTYQSGSFTVNAAVQFASELSGGTTYFPQPVALAVTPDNLHVYVALSGTNELAVITVATPTSAAQYSLPDVKSGKVGNSIPAGVAIPPLANPPATGFRVFFTSVHNSNGQVDVINDNGGSPTANTSLSFSSTTSTPQGIANIPIPAAQ